MDTWLVLVGPVIGVVSTCAGKMGHQVFRGFSVFQFGGVKALVASFLAYIYTHIYIHTFSVESALSKIFIPVWS